jgi:O-antigen ligase
MANQSGNNLWHVDLHRITFGLLWIFVFFVPWEEEIVVPEHLALSHFVGAGAALAGVIACFQRRSIRRPGVIHYLAGAFVLWAVMSYRWSISPDLTVGRAASYVQLLFMVWLIWEFAASVERQMLLIAAYVMGTWVAAISTFYAFVTDSGHNVSLVEGRYTAVGANENELGIILALGLGMACYLLARNKSPRILWFASVPVFLVAILLTGSRGSLIATSVAFMMFPVSLGRYSVTFRIAGGVALLVIAGLGAAILPETTWDRVKTIPTELSEGTLTKRTYIWSAGLDAYRHHPIAGVGAGAFEASVYKQLDIAYVAHNSYLSVLVELGAVGLTIFATLLACLIHSALGLPKVSRAAWLILLLTWGIAVSSVTWEHRKPTWFLFGLLAAQAAALKERRIRRTLHAPEARVFQRTLTTA